MKTFYSVNQQYFDNGKVIANIEKIQAEEKPKNTFEQHSRYDFYCDYFNTLKQAQKFKQETLKA
jgi:hypothetical protein